MVLIDVSNVETDIFDAVRLDALDVLVKKDDTVTEESDNALVGRRRPVVDVTNTQLLDTDCSKVRNRYVLSADASIYVRMTSGPLLIAVTPEALIYQHKGMKNASMLFLRI